MVLGPLLGQGGSSRNWAPWELGTDVPDHRTIADSFGEPEATEATATKAFAGPLLWFRSVGIGQVSLAG